MRASEAWTALRDAGLVAGQMPAPAAADVSPWFVRAMLGIAGWLAAFFLLGFIGALLSGIFSVAPACFAIGAVAIYLASLLEREYPGAPFVGQFGLAVSLAGQVLLGVGSFQVLERNDVGSALLFAVLEAGVFLALTDQMQRGIAFLLAMFGLGLALQELRMLAVLPGALSLALAFVWSRELAWRGSAPTLRSLGYALVLGLLATEGVLATMHSSRFQTAVEMHQATPPLTAGILGDLLGIGALLLVAHVALVRHGAGAMTRALALAAATALGGLGFLAEGFASAALVLLLGCNNANRVLLGLGAFAVLASLSRYYYWMEATLLTKSGVLLGTGLALLIARAVMHRVWPERGDG